MTRPHQQREKINRSGTNGALAPSAAREHLEKLEACLLHFGQILQTGCCLVEEIKRNKQHGQHLTAVLAQLDSDATNPAYVGKVAEIIKFSSSRVPIESDQDCRRDLISAIKARADRLSNQSESAEQAFEAALADLQGALSDIAAANLVDGSEIISLEIESFEDEAARVYACAQARFRSLQAKIASDPVAWNDQLLRQSAASTLPGFAEILEIAATEDRNLQMERINLLPINYSANELRCALRSLKAASSGLDYEQLRLAVCGAIEAFEYTSRRAAHYCDQTCGNDFVAKLGLPESRARIELIESYEIPDAILKTLLPLRGECMTEPEASLRQYLDLLRNYCKQPALIAPRRIDDPCERPDRFIQIEDLKLRIQERAARLARPLDRELSEWVGIVHKCEQQLSRSMRRLPILGPHAAIAAMLTCRVFYRYGNYSPYYSIDDLRLRSVACGIIEQHEMAVLDATLTALEKIGVIEYRNKEREYLKLVPGSPKNVKSINDTFSGIRNLAIRSAFLSYGGEIRTHAPEDNGPISLRVGAVLAALETKRRLERFLDRSETLTEQRELIEQVAATLSQNGRGQAEAQASQLYLAVESALHSVYSHQLLRHGASISEIAGQLILSLGYEVRHVLNAFVGLARLIEQVDNRQTQLLESLNAVSGILDGDEFNFTILENGDQERDWVQNWKRLPWRRVLEVAANVAKVVNQAKRSHFDPLFFTTVPAHHTHKTRFVFC